MTLVLDIRSEGLRVGEKNEKPQFGFCSHFLSTVPIIGFVSKCRDASHTSVQQRFITPSRSMLFPSEVGVGDDNVLRYRCTCHIPKSTSDARHASFFWLLQPLPVENPNVVWVCAVFVLKGGTTRVLLAVPFFFSTETGAPDHHHGHKLNIYSYVSQSQIVFMAFKNSVITLLKTFVRRCLFPFFCLSSVVFVPFFPSAVCDLSAVYVFTSTESSTHCALKAMGHGYEATGVPTRRSSTVSTQNGSINDWGNKQKTIEKLYRHVANKFYTRNRLCLRFNKIDICMRRIPQQMSINIHVLHLHSLRARICLLLSVLSTRILPSNANGNHLHHVIL